MDQDSTFSRFTARFQGVVVVTIQIFLMIIITLALIELVWLLVHRLSAVWQATQTVMDLQNAVQNAFAGVLLVILGLELLESVRT